MPNSDTRLVAIDVGSAKVTVLIAERIEIDGEPGLKVVGVGKAPNRGTLKGYIVNVEATVNALRRATEEAEAMAGIEISRAMVGVGDSDLRSANSHGTASIESSDRGVSRADIDLVLNAARDVPLPPDREILHAIPQEFSVDDRGGIADPEDMLGSRLEAKVHLVVGHAPKTRTLVRCLNQAGVEVADVVFEPLATAEAVLLPDERELGVLMLEIGAGTCGFAFFHQAVVQHSGVLPFGASHFTADVASVLRTSFAGAETLKLREGCCLPGLVDSDEQVAVPPIGGGASRTIAREQLAEILQARAEEIFHLVQAELEKAGCAEQPGGIVLSGGGSKLAGLPELAQEFFSRDVRYGVPLGLASEIEGLDDPTWATAAGLVRYALAVEQTRSRSVRQSAGRGMRGVMSSLRQMFSDLL